MSQTALEMAHHGRIPAEDAWARQQDEAALHATKELGSVYLDLAAKRKGGMAAVVEEAAAQLRAIPAAQHRTAQGLIATGLLDLVKLGLTPLEAAQRSSELNARFAAAPIAGLPRVSIQVGDALRAGLVDDVSAQLGARGGK
jgi:hypothetical protein